MSLFGKTKTGGQEVSFLRKTPNPKRPPLPGAPATAGAGAGASAGAVGAAAAAPLAAPTPVRPVPGAPGAGFPHATALRPAAAALVPSLAGGAASAQVPGAAAASSSAATAAAAQQQQHQALWSAPSVETLLLRTPTAGSALANTTFHIAKFPSQVPKFSRHTVVEAPTQAAAPKPRGARGPVNKKKPSQRREEEVMAAMSALAPATKWHIRDTASKVAYVGEREQSGSLSATAGVGDNGAAGQSYGPAAANTSDRGNGYVMLVMNADKTMTLIGSVDFFAFRPVANAGAGAATSVEMAELKMKKQSQLGARWASRKGMLTGDEKAARMAAKDGAGSIVADLRTIDGGDSGHDPSVGDDDAALGTAVASTGGKPAAAAAAGAGDDDEETAEDLVNEKKPSRKKKGGGDNDHASGGMDFRDNFSDDDEDNTTTVEDTELKTEGVPLEDDAEELHEVEKGADAEVKKEDKVSSSAKRVAAFLEGKKPDEDDDTAADGDEAKAKAKHKPKDDDDDDDEDDDDDDDDDAEEENEKQKRAALAAAAAAAEGKDAKAAGADSLKSKRATVADVTKGMTTAQLAALAAQADDESDEEAAAAVEREDADGMSDDDDLDDDKLAAEFGDESGTKKPAAAAAAAANSAGAAGAKRKADDGAAQPAAKKARTDAPAAAAAAAPAAAGGALGWTEADVRAVFVAAQPNGLTAAQVAAQMKGRVSAADMPRLVATLKAICDMRTINNAKVMFLKGTAP